MTPQQKHSTKLGFKIALPLEYDEALKKMATENFGTKAGTLRGILHAALREYLPGYTAPEDDGLATTSVRTDAGTMEYIKMLAREQRRTVDSQIALILEAAAEEYKGFNEGRTKLRKF